MFFKILKKDLKRKKSMNFILLIFIILATMFIASSVNNLLVATNSVDDFLESSKLSDYTVLTIGGTPNEISENDAKLVEFLDNLECVTDYRIGDYMMPNANDYSSDGNDISDTHSSIVICDIYQGEQLFFNEQNEVIEDISKGYIYLPRGIMIDNDLSVGDTFTIHVNDSEKLDLKIKGYFKDSFLGASMMGTKRFIISEEDYKYLKDNSDFVYGRSYSVNVSDSEEYEKAFSNCDVNVLFGDGWETIKMTYIMDTIIAAVFLMVSVCLVIISAIMLRFTIVFTVNEDYREIGIMKAIGINDVSVRKLYMSKYVFLAILGAALGFAISIPISRIMLEEITKNILLTGKNGNIMVNLIFAILVAVVVIFSAYLSTSKIKKLTPMDAIRSGNNGERFKRKGLIKLSDSRLKVTSFMAINDVFSELKKYMILLVASAIGVWLIVMPINTINTLRSENIANWFSMIKSDIIIAEERFTEVITSGDKEEYIKYIGDIENVLSEKGVKCEKVFSEVLFKFSARKGDNSVKTLSMQGVNSSTSDYVYDQGSAPEYENEVAITHIIAKKIDAKIGDTIYINTSDEEKPYIVTAIFQSMNNMGEGIRFHENEDVDYSAVMGGFGIQVKLSDEYNEAEKEEIIADLNDDYPEEVVQTMSEFINSMMGGIADQIASLKYVIIVLVICINILIVVLMQKMFFIREQGQMGMLKAMGYSNKDIILWQTKRIMLVLFVGIALGTVTGTLFTQVTSGQVFKIMGASRIEFQINPLEVYLVYPLAIYVITIIACVLTMFKVRKIDVSSINEEE